MSFALLAGAIFKNGSGTEPHRPDWYHEFIRRRRPNYRFSWQVYSEILEENLEYRKSWLDLGCGDNIVIAENQIRGFKIGVDRQIDSDLKSEEFCVGSAYRLPFKDRSFDLVSSRYLLEHSEEPEGILEEVSRVLKGGGIFLLQTTNRKSLWIKLSSLVPLGIKSHILCKFRLAEISALQKTYYRMNFPELFPKFVCRMGLQDLYLVEDLLRFSKFVFCGSLLYLSLLDLLGLERFRSNIIAVYKKL